MTPIRWNDAEKTLFIGKREGQFPGMVSQRVFQLVLVNENKGTGDQPEVTFDKILPYEGNKISVLLS